MLILIPLVPFAGFLLNASLGRRVSKAAAGAIACASILVSFVVSVIAVVELVGRPPGSRVVSERVFDWITSGDFTASFTLSLDPLAALMILVVTGIGSLIHIYSLAYMRGETGSEYARYFSYLSLFAGFMLLLVLGANFLVLFIGWEGVGLCSYLLIGFWYQRKAAADAGKKAFVVNRVGDFAFLLGILLIVVHFGSVDFRDIARLTTSLEPETTFGTVSLATLLLFLGATGKSAQIPLFVWLPDAMEGPTPVSALIHAATMVTAGVYMIGRNAVLFAHAPQTLAIVAVIGIATAIMAATIALVQNDIKRVLAYSTVSQLGYMFLAMGVGAYAAGIFHLYTHAFFKALLFLGSGAVIHALAGEQDLRHMGGLKSALPLTYWTFVVGALAIAGVPGLSGFFSKDDIMSRTLAGGHPVLWAVAVLTSLLTAIYMFRVVYLVFHGAQRAQRVQGAHGAGLHDAPPAMALALVVLAAGSGLAGYIGFPAALGGSNRIERFLEPSFGETRDREDASGTGAETVHPGPASNELALMVVSGVTALAGIGIATFFFVRNRRAADGLAARVPRLHRLLVNKYWVDEIYDAAVVQPARALAERGLWKGVDVRVIDGAVNGVGAAVSGGSEALRRIQNGSVRVYAASLFLGVVAILGYYLWR